MPQRPRSRRTRGRGPRPPAPPPEAVAALAAAAAAESSGQLPAAPARAAARFDHDIAFVRAELRRIGAASAICFGMLVLLVAIDRFA